MPDELASLDVERHDRVGVEVVAWTRLRIIFRYRVAGAPDGELGRRIVGPGLPEPAAARLPCVVFVLPSFAAGLARIRHRVPAPQLVASSGVERRNPAA